MKETYIVTISQKADFFGEWGEIAQKEVEPAELVRMLQDAKTIVYEAKRKTTEGSKADAGEQ